MKSQSSFHFSFRPLGLLLAACAVTLLLALPSLARASFHLMQIERIIGGVNGDTTAQAIQLRLRADGQNFLNSDAGGTQGPARLIAYDANGANPVTLLVFPNDVSNGRRGDRVLVASANFAQYTTPRIQPDFVLTNLIPASYLPAGRIVFADGVGNVLWSVSYGGGSYRGPNTGLNLNDANGNFGPAFNGPLPSRFTVSLRFRGNSTDPSEANATDYRLTDESAEVKNNRNAESVLPALPGIPLRPGRGRRRFPLPEFLRVHQRKLLPLPVPQRARLPVLRRCPRRLPRRLPV